MNSISKIGYSLLVAGLLIGVPVMYQWSKTQLETDCLSKGGQPEWVQRLGTKGTPANPAFKCVL